MITVITIIAIGASIAVPNFAGMIERNQLRGYTQTAQNAESALMALTGLQYAKTSSGNPEIPFPSWSDPDPGFVSDDQYISVEYRGLYFGPCFRVTVANATALDGNRSSAGMKEFYKRTMNRLEPLSWRSPDRAVCSVYFFLDTASNIEANVNGIADPSKFAQYRFAYSEYFMTAGGKNLAIYHGAKIDADGTPVELADGWYIYEFNGTQYTPYGSV